MSRRRLSPSARRDHLRQLLEGTVSAGATFLALVLFDRTGHGSHASWCGRLHLGAEVAKMVGRDRPYSVRQVGRWLAELVAAGWLAPAVLRYVFDDAGQVVGGLPALRRLSADLLDRLDRLGGIRRRGKGGRTTPPAEDGRPRPELQPVRSKVVGGCSSCGVVTPPGDVEELHLPGCPNAPP